MLTHCKPTGYVIKISIIYKKISCPKEVSNLNEINFITEVREDSSELGSVDYKWSEIRYLN